MNRHQNNTYLVENQYKNSSNLGNRAQLHQKYSSNPIGWFPWVFSYLDISPDLNILECGSGPGWLWRNNFEQLPLGCHITITDLSPGMVQEARQTLESKGIDYTFKVEDIQQLTFEDQSFDLVIANHMLYHVPDFDKALFEVQRVMNQDGTFVASTVGNGHMRELHEFGQKLFPEVADLYNQSMITFSLDNGRTLLEPWFESIECFEYKNVLRVTEVEPIIAYMASNSDIENVSSSKIGDAAAQLGEIITQNGAFNITTRAGIFRCSSPK